MNERKKEDNPTQDLNWLENDIPVSTRFGDSYFSIADGREETREVFISGNGLPERWQKEKTFTIAELGFGTGLNFLETLQQWRQSCPEGHFLHFVSFERFPVETSDIFRTLKRWDDLLPLTEELCRNWPPKPGKNMVEFGTAKLHLFHGDARQSLKEWDGFADAWYLDGFNPAKNPELWEEDLMQDVYAHTSDRGTFSTYTAAGWVRRNLQAAGFEVKKVPGFGHKKERLEGIKLSPLPE